MLHPTLNVHALYELEGTYLVTMMEGMFISLPTTLDVKLCLVTNGHLCMFDQALYLVEHTNWCIYASMIKIKIYLGYWDLLGAPVDPALNIIRDLLEKDHTLKERAVLAVNDIILLLEFCLKNTYFSFQDQFYEQVEGAAMGSPVSPIIANLYMEYLEPKALSTALQAPDSGVGLWMTPLSSTRRPTNKASFNTLTVLILPSGSQWRTTRRMGPSHSWTPLSNLRLMVAYPSLCTGN